MQIVSLSLSQYQSDLEMAGKAAGTIQQYLSSIRKFEDFLGHELREATVDELRAWVDHLRNQSISAARLRGHYSALIFLFRKTFGQPDKVAFISMPHAQAPLPIILAQSEIQRVLESFTVAKYRMFFTLIYGTGLRIQEASLLQTEDLDAVSQVIRVHNGKGGRDRLVPLGRRLLIALRRYWAYERPTKPWLFTSNADNPICPATARRALLCASAASGIGKVVAPHMLRHAFATHLLEQGVDVRKIQVVLGHANIKSTMIYTQVSTKEIASLRSPLEDLSVI